MKMDWTEARIIYEELSSLSANGVEPFDRLWDDLLRAATYKPPNIFVSENRLVSIASDKCRSRKHFTFWV